MPCHHSTFPPCNPNCISYCAFPPHAFCTFRPSVLPPRAFLRYIVPASPGEVLRTVSPCMLTRDLARTQSGIRPKLPRLPLLTSGLGSRCDIGLPNNHISGLVLDSRRTSAGELIGLWMWCFRFPICFFLICIYAYLTLFLCGRQSLLYDRQLNIIIRTRLFSTFWLTTP